MNATLSTTAWVLHDLGLATSVGGAVFGKAGLRRAAGSDMEQDGRGEIISEAWKNFTPINLLSHLSVGVTWLIGRSMLSGREVKRSARNLVLAKDALTGVYLVSGLASTAAGYGANQLRKAQDSSSSSVIEDMGVGEGDKAELSQRLQRASSILGTANLLAGAALLGITAVLAMQAGRSPRWSFVSRFLP
ncbi:MAG TPA: hypothetical protein VK550_26375 [Polyangiaceae bacterium]|jgi:hypothetical protein|nr:hypothetical protein [Polyangiaceae bacterium]